MCISPNPPPGFSSSEFGFRAWLLKSGVTGPLPPKCTDIEKENGVKEVSTLGVSEWSRLRNGLYASGTRQKMRRGTASHKAGPIEERLDLLKLVRILKSYIRGLTYQSRASRSLAHLAQIFNRSLTLVVKRIGYFSSSAIGRILANHHGNRAASVGTGPYANITRG